MNRFLLNPVQKGFVDASGVKCTYNTVPMRCRVSSWQHSVDDVIKAFQAVVDGQSALRTTIGRDDLGRWVQIDRPVHVGDHLTVVDLRDLSGQAQVVAIARHSQELLDTPFDLRTGAPWNGRLLVLSDRDSDLILNTAHVVFDGSSVGIVAQDLADALGGTYVPPAVSFGELAERVALQEATAADAAFWTRQCAVAPALARRWVGGPSRYDIVPVSLPADVFAGLNALRESNGVSITTALATVLSVVGHRLDGGTPMIGIATAQRKADTPRVVGAQHDHTMVSVGGRMLDEDSFLALAGDMNRMRTEGSQHRLPSVTAALAGGRAFPYDWALNYGRFGEPVPLAIAGGGTVTALPVEAIGDKITVRKVTTVAGPRSVIVSPSKDGGLTGVLVGLTALFPNHDDVVRAAQTFEAFAAAAATGPAAHIGSWSTPTA